MNARRTLPSPVAAAVTTLAVIAALALSACSASSTNSDGTYKYTSATAHGKLMPAADRKKAANFSGDLLSGGTTKLSDTTGKVVLVNFWASWCGPCKVETPQFDLLYRKLKSQGFTALGIDTKDLKPNAKSFIADNHISYPIVYDQPGETVLRLGNPPANLPFSMLLDRQGKVAAVYFGGLTVKDIQGPIDKLLAEK